MVEKPPLQRTIHYTPGRFVIAFLDLLGQKEAMLHMDPLPRDQIALNQVVAESLGNRNFMQDQIQELFYEAFEKFDQTAVEQLSRRDAELYRRLRAESKLLHYQFADTVVYYAAVNSDDCQLAAEAMSIISAVSGATLACLAHRVPVRGAITFGEALREEGTNEIYGGPLIRAFEIERDAGMPRVLVEKSLVERLRSVADHPGTSHQRVCSRQFANAALEMLHAETGKDSIVRILGGFVQKISDSEKYKDLYERAHRFVAGEAERFAHDPKLGPRYSSLLSNFAGNPIRKD